MRPIKLGETVRDSITGFEGTATARVEYINGCVQYCVMPKVDKDGKMQSGEYLDEQRLEIVGGAAVTPIAARGGPQPNAPASQYRG